MFTIAIRAGLLASGLLVLVACGGGHGTTGGTQQATATSSGEQAAALETPPPAGASIEEKLGLDVAAAKNESIEALVGGSGYSLIGPIVHRFKALPPDQRADAIRALALCLEAFFESDEFAAEYAKMRAERKPTPPTYEQTVDEELSASLAERKAQIEQMRSVTLPQMPAANRAEMEQMLAQSEAQLSDPTMVGYERQGIESKRASEREGFERDTERWQTSYPEQPKGLIVQRLNEFLALTSDVDFGAELVEKDGAKHFVKPEYEAKNGDWKWSYRAGKDSVEAARAVATQWLAELR